MTHGTTAMKRSLISDERGAMMLMGIAMAMFLTGITWYIVGIGHMLIAHDHFQEAADSAAFTSATIHARGMNLIASLNLVMLVLTGVYLLLALLFAALLAATIAAIAGVITIPAGIPIGQATYQTWNAWTKYYKFYKIAIKGINYVQTGAAVVFPWAGEAASIEVGNRYGKATAQGAEATAFTVSASMIPGPKAIKYALKGENNGASSTANAGTDLSNPPAGGEGATRPETTGGPDGVAVPDGGDGNTCGGGEGKFQEKIGLPVKARVAAELCEDLIAKILQFAIDKIRDITGVFIPDGGLINGSFGVDALGPAKDAIAAGGGIAMCGGGGGPIGDLLQEIPEQVQDVLGDIASQALPAADVDFWQDPGPKGMADGAKNGSSWMQVYGFSVGRDTDTKSGRLVSLAKGAKVRRGAGGVEGDHNSYLGYFSQAEFYFDCSDDWDTCNDDNNALYAMKWRARLRQVVVPAVVERTFASIGSVVAQAQSGLSWIADRIPSGSAGPFNALEDHLNGFLESDLAKFLHIDAATVQGVVPELGLIRVPDFSGFDGPTPVIH